jgi:CheY-like chemotaxis protein
MTAASAKKGQSVRILLADDTAAVREALTFVLESDGHIVTVATNGAQAMEALQAGPIDLAVLDIWMPQASGLDVLKTIRASWPQLPVIIMSGGGPGPSLEQATAIADLYRASHILYKPFDDEDLLALVRRYAR